MIQLGGREITNIVIDNKTITRIVIPGIGIVYNTFHQLDLIYPETVTGDHFTVGVLYDNNYIDPDQVVWSLIQGDPYVWYAGAGRFDIDPQLPDPDWNVHINAEYNGTTADAEIRVTYGNGSYDTNIYTDVDPDTGNPVTVIEITTSDGEGNTSTSTTVEQQDGSSTNTTITQDSSGNTTTSTTNNSAPDSNGSVTSNSETTNYDSGGNVTGSNTSEITNNLDGSYTSTSTNYDANGDPTDTTNQDRDSSGNVDTQDIEYDSSGEPIVTGYTIDTSGNPDGTKDFEGDGVNTQFDAFDLTSGFEARIHFKVDMSNKPPGQNENHHNILTMKRATPSPWYGFQLRHSNTSTAIILGTQFASGSNTNTNISPYSKVGNIGEYDIKINYDPTVSSNNFIARDMLRNIQIVSQTGKFPNLEELKYLTVCVGYALDANGNPYRYSKLEVLDFYIRKV